MTRRRDIPPPFVATSRQIGATSRQNVQNARPFGLPTSACAAMSMETHPGGAGGAAEGSGDTTDDEVLGEDVEGEESESKVDSSTEASSKD